MTRTARAAALILATSVAACARPEPPVSEAPRGEAVGEAPGPAPAATVPTARGTCGAEVNQHGKGFDPAARACLWDAYEAGKAASLVVTVYTIEGDPMTFTIETAARGEVIVTRDSKDRLGAPGVTRHACTSLRKSQPEGSDRYGFVASGCKGPEAEVSIPG